MKKHRIAFLLLLLAASIGTAPASAATFLFVFEGADGTRASFTIDDAIAPSITTNDMARYDNVAVQIGSASTLGSMIFYRKQQGGGLAFDNGSPIVGTGEQLFKGSARDPKFFETVETIRWQGSRAPAGTLSISRVVTPVAAPVPEPAGWGLLLLGFTALGGMLRRRTIVARVRYSTHAKPL